MSTKVTGKRGSWFAKVRGEDLPCVHEDWCYPNPQKGKGFYYLDKGFVLGEKKWDEFIEALKIKKRAILRKNKKRSHDTEPFELEKYVAVFKIDNVLGDENGLRFDFNERIEDVI
jgi:hypothetical protein